MNSQKAENVLNLATETPLSLRNRSLELNIGYMPLENSWEILFRYSGEFSFIENLGYPSVKLLGSYGLAILPETELDFFASLPQILYIEKPKNLFFQDTLETGTSCLTALRSPSLTLTGKGILLAIIDSGITYSLPCFRKPDGSTRIRFLWDQSIPGAPPAGYFLGTEYTEVQINQALFTLTARERERLVPSFDSSGHGTAVCGIAAGKDDSYEGIAPDSELLIVKLPLQPDQPFPRTTQVIQAINYVIEKAQELRMPLAINLSFGNTYGAHDGSSLLEQYLTDVSRLWKSTICTGTGNEGDTNGHISGTLSPDKETILELSIAGRESALNLQLWKAYPDQYDLLLRSPSGTLLGPIPETRGSQTYLLDRTQLLLYYGKPSPYSIDQEIWFDFLPQDDFLVNGIWQIILRPRRIITGRYALWLPSESQRNPGTGFLRPTVSGTNTIPSTANGAISVGAYNPATLTYAPFSGRGQMNLGRRIRPDLVAPGVNILAPTSFGTYESFTGTSFATPFVTGASALLMEWGMTEENDPYLYGEKIRAYLQRGAAFLPGITTYPNNEAGWGRLCIAESLPLF